jgi:hypothetical protein
MLRRAVYGMLPKNNLREARMRKLRVFPGPEHPFKGVELVAWQMPPRTLRDRGLGWVPPPGFAPMNPAAYAQRMRGSRLLQQQQQQQQLPLVAGAGQQQQQQGHVGVPLVGVATAGSNLQGAAGAAKSGAPVSFEDLLMADELAFVRSQARE